jgi:hypothetical protein
MKHEKRSSPGVFASHTWSLAVALVAAASIHSPAIAQTPSGAAPLADGGATYVYVAEQMMGYNSPASILQFHADASGHVSPSNSLELPMASGALAFTVDSSGQIYAALPAYYERSGSTNNLARRAEVAIYPPNTSGAATPARVITEGLMNYPASIAVGRYGEIYVADASGSIFVFSDTADGQSVPIRNIHGNLTHLDSERSIGGIVLDADGYLYVSSGKSILVFAPDADKNVAPVRTISTTYAGCNVSFRQLGLDDRENLYTRTGNQLTTSGPNLCTGIPPILVFAAGADGDSSPLKTLTPARDGKRSSGDVFSFGVDRAGNLFTINLGGNEILGFGPGSDKDALPALRMVDPDLTQRMIPALALQ